MSFDLAARERFLALVSVGQTVEMAAAIAGTSRQTVSRWAARGRAPGASAEYATFAVRLDAIRSGLAEDVARRLAAEQEPDEGPDLDDPFLLWEPSSMAKLTPEQQRIVTERTLARWDVVQARHAELDAERGSDPEKDGPRA